MDFGKHVRNVLSPSVPSHREIFHPQNLTSLYTKRLQICRPSLSYKPTICPILNVQPCKLLNVLLTFVLMKCRLAQREQLRKSCFLLSLSVTPTPQFPPSANTVMMATSLLSLLVFLLSPGQVEGIPILSTGRRGRGGNEQLQ